MPVPSGLDFSGRTLTRDSDLPPGDLKGANFDNATLVGLQLRDRILADATFRGAHLQGVGFGGVDDRPDTGADLQRVDFEGAIFDSTPDGQSPTTLNGTFLYETCFIGATFVPRPSVQTTVLAREFVNDWPFLRNTDFSYSDIFSIRYGIAGLLARGIPSLFRGLKIPCRYLSDSLALNGINFLETDISACPTSLQGMDLSGKSFDNLNLQGFLFAGATLNGTSFRNVNFGGTSPETTVDVFGQAGSMNGAIFSGATIRYITFKNVSLKGADFSHAKFFLAGFENAQLQDAHFEGSSGFVEFAQSALAGVHFESATLSVSFPYSTFSADTDFTGASLKFDSGAIDLAFTNLSGVRFDGATLVNANFSAATLTNASFKGATAPGANFNGASARGAHFDGAFLSNSRWGKAILEFASFQSATLDSATGLNGARLTGALFNQASARNVDFSNAALYGADFTGADLEAADFTGAKLIADPVNGIGSAARFSSAHLKNVSFARAALNSVSFQYASLYGSALGAPAKSCTLASAGCGGTPRTGGTCSCASAQGADLTRTDFSNAFLYGVDFSTPGTIVNGTIFSGAILVSANFNAATFSVDPSQGGAAPAFDAAWLQGADLSTAALGGSTLNHAFVDFGSNNADGSQRRGNRLHLLLSNSYTQFRNWNGSSATPCIVVEYTAASALPGNISDLVCPSGLRYATGCGAELPRDPNVATNPNWYSGSSVTNNQPVAGWYEHISTYEDAATGAAVCHGAPTEPKWFAVNPPP